MSVPHAQLDRPFLHRGVPPLYLELVGLDQGGPVAARDQLFDLVTRQVDAVVEVPAPEHQVVREHGAVLKGEAAYSIGQGKVYFKQFSLRSATNSDINTIENLHKSYTTVFNYIKIE